MELEKELLELEAGDKDLAKRDSPKLVFILQLCQHMAHSINQKNLDIYLETSPDIKFKIEGRKVYREIHQFDGLYREEHLKQIFPGIPVYEIETKYKFKE